MTVANLNVKTTYEGDGAAVNFPITFDLKDKDVVKVFLINEAVADPSTPSGLAEVEKFEGGDFAFDTAPPVVPTRVEMIVAPTGTEKLRVERVSPLTQPDDLVSGTDANEVIETRLDELTHQSQEQDARLGEIEPLVDVPSVSGSTSADAPDWTTGTAFTKDNLVVNVSTLYRALSDHTSSIIDFDTDFAAGKWQLLSGIRGVQGLQGNIGNVGNNGAAGAAGGIGLTGAAGNDGIFSAIATQGEAQAGVNNTKGMSPLRTAEAITAQVDELGIVANTNSNSAQDILISDLISRVSILESLVQQATGKFAGQQVLLNNQAAPVELLGLLNGGANDKGAGFSRQLVGTEFAEVMVYFRRKTDSGDRFSSTTIVMQNVDGGWLIGRKGTEQLDVALDLDGVVLSINAGSGQVSYTSDAMAGANHDTQSLIAWLGQEI